MPLKYLSNFWRSLEISLIDWRIRLKITQSNYCVLWANENDNANDNDKANNIISTMKDRKLYVPVATLSAKNNQKLSKLLGKKFDR